MRAKEVHRLGGVLCYLLLVAILLTFSTLQRVRSIV